MTTLLLMQSPIVKKLLWIFDFCLVITFGTLYSRHFASKIKMLFFIPRYLPLFSTISAFYHLPQSFRSFRIIIKSWLCATRWAYSPAGPYGNESASATSKETIVNVNNSLRYLISECNRVERKIDR
jgi:hypothetical protein